MDTIGESATPWRAYTELAIAPNTPPERTPRPGGDAAPDDGFEPFGEDGFTFLDFVDIINPLHHIPVIGTLYRQLSGDTIDAATRVMGGTLFFGPLGTVASVANVLVEEGTGKDIGEHVVAFFDEAEPDRPGRPGGEDEVVADAGARANPPPPEPIDPVTAWAMAEVAYRKSAAEKVRSTTPPGGDSVDGSAPGTPATLSALGVGGAPRPGNGWAPRTAPAGLTDAARAADDARSAATLFRAAAYGLGRPRAPSGSATADAPPGAIGQGGGWFTETMLTALERYDDGAALNAAPGRTAVDIQR